MTQKEPGDNKYVLVGEKWYQEVPAIVIIQAIVIVVWARVIVIKVMKVELNSAHIFKELIRFVNILDVEYV